MDLKHCVDLKHTYIPKGIDKVSFVYIKLDKTRSSRTARVLFVCSNQ